LTEKNILNKKNPIWMKESYETRSIGIYSWVVLNSIPVGVDVLMMELSLGYYCSRQSVHLKAKYNTKTLKT